jgi:hypothetical protein
VTCWVGRYPPRGALEDASGHRKFVTVLTHRTPPSAGLAPRVTPGRGRNEHKRSYALGVCDRRQDLISAYMSTKREGEERMKPRTRAREGRGFSGVICGLLSQTTWGIEGTKI